MFSVIGLRFVYFRIVNVITEDGIKISKTETVAAAGTTSTGKAGKTLLNGMDALCTAAAMMADKPGGENEAEHGDSGLVETIVGETEVEAPSTNPAIRLTSAVAGVKRQACAEGDVVTYYRPVGPIQIVNREKQQTTQHNSQRQQSSILVSAATAATNTVHMYSSACVYGNMV